MVEVEDSTLQTEKRPDSTDATISNKKSDLPTSAVETVDAQQNSSKKRVLEDDETSPTTSKELRTKSPEPKVERKAVSSELPSSSSAAAILTAVRSVAALEPEAVVQLSMGQVLELTDAALAGNLTEEEEDEADVAAVLGDCSDTECSYKEGYKKRQALYSCLTCYDKSKEVAGICLACTNVCHEGHKFVEMYTKRNFRCDCGNSKFSGLACKLTPNKDILNENNQYNQNFSNLYCICHRPHPDPELLELVQVQCILCEDWFHLEHALNLTKEEIAARLEETRSMICKACRETHKFTNYYIAEESDEGFEFDKNEHKIDGCALEFLKKKFPSLPVIEEAGWTMMDWHEDICKCPKCLEMYAAEKVEFLLDPEDSFHHYSERGIAKAAEDRNSEGESAMREIMSSLPRFGQIEFASAFAEMRNNLVEMMENIHQQGGVITATAIEEVFEGLRKKREARMAGLNQDEGGSSGGPSQ